MLWKKIATISHRNAICHISARKYLAFDRKLYKIIISFTYKFIYKPGTVTAAIEHHNKPLI